MQIKQQFVVDGQTFDTVEAAQAYIDSNATRVRVAAFVEHLKANGAQRVSKAVTDAIEKFIEFEEGNSTAEKLVKDTPTEKGTTGDSEGNADTAAESGKPVDAAEKAEPAQGSGKDDTTTAAVAGQTSKHVDGPNEELEEDPLADLDFGE